MGFDAGRSGLDTLGSLGSATPWGAAASALGGAIATPNTSATGDVATGAITVGGINFASDSSNLLPYVAIAVLAFLVMRSGRRRKG